MHTTNLRGKRMITRELGDSAICDNELSPLLFTAQSARYQIFNSNDNDFVMWEGESQESGWSLVRRAEGESRMKVNRERGSNKVPSPVRFGSLGYRLPPQKLRLITQKAAGWTVDFPNLIRRYRLKYT